MSAAAAIEDAPLVARAPIIAQLCLSSGIWAPSSCTSLSIWVSMRDMNCSAQRVVHIKTMRAH